MKGLICYFSTTGNTEIVCKSIAAKIGTVEWDFYNLTKCNAPAIENYDIIGLGTYTEFWGPPRIVEEFIENMKKQDRLKPAFVLNAHAGESGKTLMILNDWMKSKGFKVIAGHSIAMPVNYPPALADGWSNPEDPSEQSIRELDSFISQLAEKLESIDSGKEISEFVVSISEKDMSFPFAVRTTAKEDMGELFVDAELCTKCGLCEKVCPYKAIKADSVPVIDNSKCYGCWTCFNKCASKAIYTNKVRGCGYYEKPIEKLKKLFSL